MAAGNLHFLQAVEPRKQLLSRASACLTDSAATMAHPYKTFASMHLDQWTSLEPSALKQRLLDNTLAFDEVSAIDLYNALILKASDEPVYVAKLAESAVEAFESMGETDEALLFMELHARSHLANHDIDSAMATVERIMALDNSACEATALELAEDIFAGAGELGTTIDQIPNVLKQVASIYRHFDKHEEHADLYLRSALIYSRHGATQSAYRCAVDAEEIANALQSLPLLARCYGALTAIACEEPDFRWAIDVGEKALLVYEQERLEVPADLLSNLGVAHMNVDELELATGYFEQSLTRSDISRELASAIQVNLSTCLRRRNQLPQAEAALAAAEAIGDVEAHPELGLELALSAAKLAIAKGDVSLLVEKLQVASCRLDSLLSEALRLHHRRGVRERYIVRIEEMLRAFPPHGSAADALIPITATRGNAMSDWLAILSWAAELRTAPNFSSALADELDKTICRIQRLGAPHLYGFREKYDDPWSVGNFGGVWDDLSQLCARIAELGLPLPLAEATSRHQASLCRARLTQGHCLMFTTYAGDSALLWCFIGDRYTRVTIPWKPLSQWYRAQLEYAQATKSRPDFNLAMGELAEALSPLLDPVFADIAAANCASVRYVEDSFGEVPWMLFALRNAELADRMTAGEFHVRLVPALAEPLADDRPLSAVATIVDRREDLLLAPYEGSAFARAAGLSGPSQVSADTKGDLKSALGDCDVLIVSTHGHSLRFFTDAYFAHLGGPTDSHVIHVSSLQEEAPDLRVRLAILNTCYSGSKSSRNFQKAFRTSDAVAIPNLFLLNRRAVALAGAWKISDTASLVIAHLIGEGLARGLGPSAAIASSLARLRHMTRSSTTAILAKNLPESLQPIAISRIAGAPEHGMFSHPYFTAGLAIHGLL